MSPAPAGPGSAASGPAQNLWEAAVARNPEHARGYADRWRRIEASGQDIHGEARLIDAMAARGSRVLDAGCGTGRLGGYLAGVGHHVTGVDLDPTLIGVARQDHPAARWETGNLAELDLRDEHGQRELFDLVVCAGNVLTFLSGAERVPALTRIAQHLAPDGRFVAGFGPGHGYPVGRFEVDAASAGLRVQQRFAGWDLQPRGEGAEGDDEFLVAVLTQA
ncbi:class I SAM-dependent methyltransferase [Brachybacterium sp. p3-SID1565]|uniref:class I SAM-dependent methyltransferase n=1 Tax=Brachybacterium TaxID=43668 RepID=UPI001D137C10|nr:MULTISPECIES: class I SAM-dependent methyltransferase [Brachybacterium]MCT1384666.1 class I SAM-dependent methyltransferase [Brachybacterium sp. p3-SID1565]